MEPNAIITTRKVYVLQWPYEATFELNGTGAGNSNDQPTPPADTTTTPELGQPRYGSVFILQRDTKAERRRPLDTLFNEHELMGPLCILVAAYSGGEMKALVNTGASSNLMSESVFESAGHFGTSISTGT